MSDLGSKLLTRVTNCTIAFAAICLAALCSSVQAVTIDWVTVGNAGNAADPETGFGSVGYVYRIAKYEVTVAQYTEFLNAVATIDDPHGLWHPDMASPLNTYGGHIERTGAPGSYTYTSSAIGANRPVDYVSFWDAARFANWLHNDQPVGAQGSGTTEDGAYINLDDFSAFARTANANTVLPTEDEWYKAAYHKNDGATGNYFDYPTSSDTAPGASISGTIPNLANFFGNVTLGISSVGALEGSPSPYGTFDQGGNLWEWNETLVSGARRGARGGSFDNPVSLLHANWRDDEAPFFEHVAIGFRVASPVVPVTPGDYNFDGDVDTFDYDKWRETFGSTTNLMADGNDDGTVNAADYVVWRKHLGTMAAATSSSATTVPEPGSVFLLLVAAMIAFFECGIRNPFRVAE